MEIEFKGNGEPTNRISLAFNRLLEDLKILGEKKPSDWSLHLKGNQNILIADAEQLVNDAKNILIQVKAYCNK